MEGFSPNLYHMDNIALHFLLLYVATQGQRLNVSVRQTSNALLGIYRFHFSSAKPDIWISSDE